MQRSLTVHLNATCWNEEKMLPYFFRHYDTLVSRYFVFDDGSTDRRSVSTRRKNFSCGEGGALLINDAQFNQRAEILREKGTDRSRFFGGEIDKYNWVDVGSSYLPSDLFAAFLRSQLEHRDQIQSRRRHVWQNYARELASWAETNGARLPIILLNENRVTACFI